MVIDCEEDRTLRAVQVGMLREAGFLRVEGSTRGERDCLRFYRPSG